MDYDLVRAFGAPLALLVMGVPAIWKGFGWIADNIAKPLTARHLQFINEVTETNKGVNDTLVKLASIQDQRVTKEERMVELMVENNAKMEKLLATSLDNQKAIMMLLSKDQKG